MTGQVRAVYVIACATVYWRLVSEVCRVLCFFFFFQAEDGIRYLTVTGVQTCALPISERLSSGRRCDFSIVSAWSEEDGQVHPCLISHDRHIVAKLTLEFCDQHAPSFSVDRPHSPHVSGKVAFADKI